MSLIYNGTEIKKLVYNNIEIKEGYYNGTKVYSSGPDPITVKVAFNRSGYYQQFSDYSYQYNFPDYIYIPDFINKIKEIVSITPSSEDIRIYKHSALSGGEDKYDTTFYTADDSNRIKLSRVGYIDIKQRTTLTAVNFSITYIPI